MRLLLLLLVTAFYSVPSFAQGGILKPVKWEASTNHVEDNVYEIILSGSIKDGWGTYSQESDENGPIPTTINFDEGSHFELLGKAREVGKKIEAREPLFDNVLVAKYKHDVKFIQKVKILDHAKSVSGYLNFMACNDRTCTPPTDFDFEFTFPKIEKEIRQVEQEIETPEKAASETIEKKTNEQHNKSSKDNASKAVESTSSSKEASADQINTNEEKSGNQDNLQINSNQILDPVKWSFKHVKSSDNVYELEFVADIQKNWTVYSQFIDEDGPIPTSFTFEDGGHYKRDSDIQEISDHRYEGIDPVFDVNVIKYKEQVKFIQKVQVTDITQPIKGELEFMSCDDTKCLPPKYVPFEFRLDNSKAAIGTMTKMNIDGDLVDQRISSLKETYIEPIGNCGEEDVAKDKSWIMTFLFGFVGGLLALLTPCVFPMIPLTVSYFTKGSKDRASGIRNGLIYGLSIIAIYVGIGLIVTNIFGTSALNELSTNWIANVLFFLIFIFFALSFFGYYEITLPSSWANKSDKMADKGGYIGIFFMAFTLSLVSFSCTGPIIGAALVQSATSTLGPLVVMLGFSSALALPFGLFAAFPAWLNSLPRSGSWMTSVKVVLGFLELALAFKFLSVADMTQHWNILGYEIYMAIWVIIFGAMALYLFGFIRFPHDSPIKKLPLMRKILAFSILGLTIYLASGFTYNSKTESYNALKLMSGLAPPTQYNYFLPEPEVDPVIKAKYPSFTKCANNLDCFKDYYEGVNYAKENNLPVLLDFTGYGCVNCRKTEEHIWIEDKVWNNIQKEFVLISLYVDDRKKLPETLRSVYENTKLRTVGNKWADFQIVNFEQNSQPLYVMMTPEEKVIAKPRGYKEGAKDYNEFLECGLEVYKGIN